MEAVTVYIPCHNAAEFIAGCLESLLDQSLRPAEILVVNDASTDRTVEIAGNFPVRVINLTSHQGLAAARNAALGAASFDYIASVDADCIPEPAWLEILMRALMESDAAGTGGRLIEKYQDSLADRWRACHMRQNWGCARLVNPPFLFGCNTLFRKSALEKVGRYDIRFRTNGEDVDISHRLRDQGYQLIYEPSAMVRHLKRDTLLSILKADWSWGYISSGDTVKFERYSNIVYHNFTNAKYRFLKDLSFRRYSILPVDITLFFVHTYFDLGHVKSAALQREPNEGLSSRVDTLTSFHSHLVGLSESHFLQNPDTIDIHKRKTGDSPAKILFALFGAMGDIFNGLPVVKALRGKYPEAEITWLTLPRYKEIAESSPVDRVLTHGTGRHGDGIPQELLEREKFDLVFFPQGSINHDEWEQSRLHMVDFMARKCGVAMPSRAPEVAIDRKTKAEVDEFWKRNSPKGKTVISIGCSALSCRPWPLAKFSELTRGLTGTKTVAVLLIGGEEDPLLPDAIDCRNVPLKTGIEIISRCDLFIGCDSGPSWMASCTDTRIIVFMDPVRQRHVHVGFKNVMPEKEIMELSIESSVEEVMNHIRRLLGERYERLPSAGKSLS